MVAMAMEAKQQMLGLQSVDKELGRGKHQRSRNHRKRARLRADAIGVTLLSVFASNPHRYYAKSSPLNSRGLCFGRVLVVFDGAVMPSWFDIHLFSGLMVWLTELYYSRRAKLDLLFLCKLVPDIGIAHWSLYCLAPVQDVVFLSNCRGPHQPRHVGFTILLSPLLYDGTRCALTLASVLLYPGTLGGGAVFSGWVLFNSSIIGRISPKAKKVPVDHLLVILVGQAFARNTHGMADCTVLFEAGEAGPPFLEQASIEL
ncbi:hypothetical protein ZIOFF_046274 [Zingiber officinale]|uniref:Uncharacterized protein n=1 Tax=Zingiber officinale TaxID=94328 RepID=A0A8J5GE23_ZINOF|nr:hypothetical protein ZIOFF_046274 [Zingiber officinale]